MAIARAVMAEPRVLLIDEPSLGLAPKIVDMVFKHIEGLAEDKEARRPRDIGG